MAPVPTDLSKLSNVVKNDVFKKTEHNAKIKDIEDIIPSVTNLDANGALNAKINKVKGKIPNIANLATTAALTFVEDEIPSVSDLVKKADYDAKISEIEKNVLLLPIIIS